MMRLAGVFRLAALISLVSAQIAYTGETDGWIQIAVPPGGDIDVAWAEGEFTGDEVSLRGSENGAFVLTNTSDATQPVSNLTLLLSDPSRFEIVTLSATSGRTTHMTSVMNPTGADVLPFDSAFALDGGQSVGVTVDVTPAP